MAVTPIPDGYTAITPYLIVDNTPEAIEFYKRAFGAEEVMRMCVPGSTQVVHAEIRIGGAILMLSDACAEWGMKSPKSLGGNATSIHLYVDDADAVFDAAVAAGATSLRPMADAFWGARHGQVTDPFGHVWSVATQISEPSMEEMQAGLEAMLSDDAQCAPPDPAP